MHHPEFPIAAFLCAALLLVPLPWHWRARNVATMSIIAWLFVANVIYGVDSIVWAGNIDEVIPVWCDITNNIIIGCSLALPSACLCVCIHLERVASVRQARTTRSDKRRRMWFEAFMCFLLPILFMALHYTVQGHRYDIIEDYGCRPTTYISVPGILAVWAPPLLLSVITLIFASLAFVHFMRRRINFAKHLEESRSALTTTRYMRLILMSVVQMVWGVSVTSIDLWFSTLSIRPWLGWVWVHSDFSRVDLYPTIFTPQFVLTYYYVAWWTIPISSLIFVLFFAFGEDAINEYRSCLVWIRRRIFRRHSPSTTFGSLGSLPSYASANAIKGPTLSLSDSVTESKFGDDLPTPTDMERQSSSSWKHERKTSDVASSLTHLASSDIHSPPENYYSPDVLPDPSSFLYLTPRDGDVLSTRHLVGKMV